MPLPFALSLLDQTLRGVARRYRLQETPEAARGPEASDPATALAVAIDHARAALAAGSAPAEDTRRGFIDALSRLIHGALRADPAFQAMVLRHRSPQVREYASLCAHASPDHRSVRTVVDALAHPGKRRGMPDGPLRDALAQLHAAAAAGDWSTLAHEAARLLATLAPRDDAGSNSSPLTNGLQRLLDDPALARLRRLDGLASDPLAQRYQMLWARQGPRPGTAEAAAQGLASRRRGIAVETLAERTIAALADRLAATTGDGFRVATSMRVPASMPGNAERAKTEWDVVLLRQSAGEHATPAWDVCLLVEAKASTDAASTDLPRLLRGLRLLAHADAQTVYPFDSHQGPVHLRGASLATLATDEPSLMRTVLYFSDAPAESAPRLLGAASRMQLLSAQPSLDYASQLLDGEAPDPQRLESVWHQLLASPRWGAVREQYPLLRQVRALMVHADDLQAAIERIGMPPA